jgi:hypothetical protein
MVIIQNIELATYFKIIKIENGSPFLNNDRVWSYGVRCINSLITVCHDERTLAIHIITIILLKLYIGVI